MFFLKFILTELLHGIKYTFFFVRSLSLENHLSSHCLQQPLVHTVSRPLSCTVPIALDCMLRNFPESLVGTQITRKSSQHKAEMILTPSGFQIGQSSSSPFMPTQVIALSRTADDWSDCDALGQLQPSFSTICQVFSRKQWFHLRLKPSPRLSSRNFSPISYVIFVFR